MPDPHSASYVAGLVSLLKLIVPCAFLVAFLTTGCREEKITSYSVPKDTGSSSSAPDGDRATPQGGNRQIQWKTPAGWEEKPGNEMRAATFAITGPGDSKAEVSIIPFPGSVGSELDNVNRWRGQVGLPPGAADDLKPETVRIGDSEGKLHVLTGAEQTILAASLARSGTTWFFKMMGNDKLVRDQHPTFVDFLKSIEFGSEPKSQAETRPVSTNAKNLPPEGSSARPSWDLPSFWKEKPPGPMVLARFSAGTEAGPHADITVSSFPGDVGGPLANVNRWRAQMGLNPIQAIDLTKETRTVDVKGGQAMLVDINGNDSRTGQPARMVAAMVSRGQESWFFKLMGDPGVVEAQKADFIKFVQSVSYSK